MTLAIGNLYGRSVFLASGTEARGLVYAVLGLTDRVLYSDTIVAAFSIAKPMVGQTRNAVRSISPSFQSELEDKPWFNDKTFWTE